MNTLEKAIMDGAVYAQQTHEKMTDGWWLGDGPESYLQVTVAQNIYDDVPASRDYLDTYGMRDGRNGIFDTIGEICEIKGLADDSTQQEDVREAAIRRIANLITVRSSTFTVWVLAQSIKQPNTPARLQPIGTLDPTVDLPPTGEVKAQAVVERYENPPGSVPKFRTRYFRYLYN